MPFSLANYGSGPYQTQIPTPTPTGPGGAAISADIQTLTDAANANHTAASNAASTASSASTAAAAAQSTADSAASSIASHEARTDNPHAVSAAQTGAYTTAQTDSLLAAKAPLASPALTGTPTAPTAAAGTNTTQLATTAFVRTEVAALVNAAPSTLDTLGEIATQLASDESTAAALATTVGTKLAKSANLSDVANVSTARTNLGLGTIATQDASNINVSGGSLDGVTLVNVTLDDTGQFTIGTGGSNYIDSAGNIQATTIFFEGTQTYGIYDSGQSRFATITVDGAAGFGSGISVTGAVAATGKVTGSNIGSEWAFSVSGNGAAIVAGSADKVLFQAQYDYTVQGWAIGADASGSIQFDVKVGTSVGTLASIVASAPPNLSSAQTGSSTTLTGWTTSITAGKWVQVSVTSSSTVKKADLVLKVKKA